MAWEKGEGSKEQDLLWLMDGGSRKQASGIYQDVTGGTMVKARARRQE